MAETTWPQPWLSWDGGEAPFDWDEWIVARYRNGSEDQEAYLCESYNWEHDGSGDDIIQFRLADRGEKVSPDTSV